MTIPTAKELDEWVAAMEKGQAVTEMMPRFVAGYRALLKVAEKAESIVDGSPDRGWMILHDVHRACVLLDELEGALDALKGQKALALEDKLELPKDQFPPDPRISLGGKK